MNLKTAASLLSTIGILATSSALRGGAIEENSRLLAGNYARGNSGNKPWDRPFGGASGLLDRIQNNFQTIDCGNEFPCSRPNGSEGTFVLRTLTHPILGQNRSKAICIDPERGWARDQCGCGDDGCPEQPVFMDLGCDESTQPQTGFDNDSTATSVNRARSSHVDTDVVCRILANPFTGDDKPITIRIPENRGQDGDECGCCNGECPERGEQRFPRPDFAERTCQNEGEQLITCTLPGRGEDATRSAEGHFVCRTMYDARTSDMKRESVCISDDRGWETDECGCCGPDCPERPRPLEIDCQNDEDQCTLRSGEAGAFVCRGIFHPVDGQSRLRSMCIPKSRSWVTDSCGCCTTEGAGGVCPNTPEGGFASEDEQLLAFALEDPAAIENIASAGPLGGNSNSGAARFKLGATLLVSGALALLT